MSKINKNQTETAPEQEPEKNGEESSETTEEKASEQNSVQNAEQYTKRTYFFIAVAMLALAAVAFGCTFIPNAGVYCLIASVLLELSALSFLSTQKKRNNFKAVRSVTILAYILLALSLLIFIGGMIFVIVSSRA